MPRGRCHFALMAALHDRFHDECPEAAAFADAHTPDLLAGTCAPDGLRFVGNRGKFATHFYSDDRRETWGRSVSGLFGAHPDLADPRRLSGADVAVMLGYISHLTVDEAFRDEVTVHVYGIEDWRPIVMGLWSMVDGFRIGNDRYLTEVHRFGRDDSVGFIDCRVVRDYLDLIKPWALEDDPWELERIFLRLRRCDMPEGEARRTWERNVAMAARFLDDDRRMRFYRAALDEGMAKTLRYLKGDFASQERGD
ncbi:MAG: hypothetical protein OXU79_06035 [Gemmatimonadota bacterium]|nr:hypothetical protein [Gemmatimonadota bacterium]